MNDGLVGGDNQSMRFLTQRNVVASSINLPTLMTKTNLKHKNKKAFNDLSNQNVKTKTTVGRDIFALK